MFVPDYLFNPELYTADIWLVQYICIPVLICPYKYIYVLRGVELNQGHLYWASETPGYSNSVSLPIIYSVIWILLFVVETLSAVACLASKQRFNNPIILTFFQKIMWNN